MSKPAIAIDGPAASGKSSVAQNVARRLGFAYVNSGSLYRALTWWALEENVDVRDAAALATFAGAVTLSAHVVDAGLEISVASQNPDSHLRDERVNGAVSLVSKSPEIRALVLDHLRGLAEEAAVVMEGRDIGTVVFPDTPYKFYIDASPEVRAARREAQGEKDSIAERDRIDSSRAEAPLSVAPDAVVIDTSEMSLDDVVWAVLSSLAEQGLMPHGA